MKILVADFSQYEHGKSYNGGQYGFSREYEVSEDETTAKVKHYTTAEFHICEGCGAWDRDREHDCDGVVPVEKITRDINQILRITSREMWCKDSYVSISVDGKEIFRRRGE